MLHINIHRFLMEILEIVEIHVSSGPKQAQEVTVTIPNLDNDKHNMKIQNAIKAVIATFLIGGASQAMAATITLDASLPTGYLSNGSYQGSFNGAPYLPSQFSINSIAFSFTFADDASDNFLIIPVSSTTTLGTPNTVNLMGGDTRTTTINTKTDTVSRVGEQESVLLSFGSQVYSGQTGAVVSPVASTPTPGTPVNGATVYLKGGNQTCTPGSAGCKANYYVTVTNTVTNTTTTNYTGDIAFNGLLQNTQDLLDSLLQNKALNFALGVTGDLNLTGASLVLDFTEILPPPVNDVPEPGSLALFGIALLGAASARRARRG